MAQYNITIDSEILHYLFLKGVKDEGMTKLLESVLNQVLQHKLPSRLKLSHMKGLKKEKIIVMVITEKIRDKGWEYSIADS